MATFQDGQVVPEGECRFQAAVEERQPSSSGRGAGAGDTAGEVRSQVAHFARTGHHPDALGGHAAVDREAVAMEGHAKFGQRDGTKQAFHPVGGGRPLRYPPPR